MRCVPRACASPRNDQGNGSLNASNRGLQFGGRRDEPEMPGQGYVRPKKLHVDPDEPLYLVCRRPAFAHSAMSSLEKSDSEVNQRCRRGERAPPPNTSPAPDSAQDSARGHERGENCLSGDRRINEGPRTMTRESRRERKRFFSKETAKRDC